MGKLTVGSNPTLSAQIRDLTGSDAERDRRRASRASDGWMELALGEARAALEHDDVPVGAVVVHLPSGEIVASVSAQTDRAALRRFSISNECSCFESLGQPGEDIVNFRAARREWDSNPRWVAPHTLSKRADSAALASLPGGAMLVARSQHVSGDPAALERFR